MSHHPQLSVFPTGSAGAGPSTPALPRRPQGARRRGVMPGLFIANPDNSDDESSPPKTGSQKSPSGSAASALSTLSSGGKSGACSMPVPQPASPSLSRERGSLPFPSIPAPQSSPLPSISAFPSPQPSIAMPSPNSSPYGHTPEMSPVPPQPPPQPQRHLQRAFTTPIPEQPSRPSSDSLLASAGGPSIYTNITNSPTRALPPLPSPTRQSPHTTSQSPSIARGQTYPAPSYPPHTLARVSSPEDALSPATGSDGGSIMSVSMSHRNRSGSMHGQQVRLQVTTDNDNFSLVDITGISTAEGIREKVFSKIRVRDEDYHTLAIFPTEIGELPDTIPITPAALLNLCQTQGDSKATLKFLVRQTNVPPSSAASVIPPVNVQSDIAYRSAADTRRAVMPPIVTDVPNPLLSRVSSHQSKEDSQSSASGELLERGGGLSASDWSDLGHDAEEWNGNRAKKTVVRHSVVRLSSSTGGSRSPNADHSTGSPMAPYLQTTHEASAHSSPTSRPSSRHYDTANTASPPPQTQSSVPHIHNGSLSSDFLSSDNTSAGPSHAESSRGFGDHGLGLSVDDDVDPETRALLEMLQKEEQDEQKRKEEERKRQLQQDEELAKREQQNEREIWEMMQQMQREQRQREHTQIAEDGVRARRVEAEQIHAEEQRQIMEAASTAWQAEQREMRELQEREQQNQREQRERQEQREQKESRIHAFAENRKQRQQFFLTQAKRGLPIEDTAATWDATWNGPPPAESSLSARRPSEGRLPLLQTPTPRPSGNQPPATRQSSQPPYASAYQADTYSSRRPSGFISTPYAEPSHVQERLSDARLQQSTGRSATPGQRVSTVAARPESQRARHPFSYTPHEQSNEHLQTSTLQGARSMDNLRMMGVLQGMSSRQASGPPLRSAVTPTPGYSKHRTFQSATNPSRYRSPSTDRTRDGRYPDTMRGTSRSSSQLAAIDTGLVPFPSPHPNSVSSSWRNGPSGQYSSLPRLARSPMYESRPNTVHYDRSPPPHTSPDATIPPRPSTYYDELQPPDSARTIGGEFGYLPSSSFGGSAGRRSRVRSGSASALYNSASPTPLSPNAEDRRYSESSAYDDAETILPYAHNTSPESSWLSVSRFGKGRNDTDTVSIAGTVSSESTVRPGKSSGEDNDTNSGDTAKALQLSKQFKALMAKMGPSDNDGTVRPGGQGGDEDEDEATLFITAPAAGMSGSVRSSPSKPNLIVNTSSLGRPGYNQSNLLWPGSTPYDSATESEGTGEGETEFEGRNIKRGKSFARSKDPNQWNFRPEPEQLYENLDRVFPQIDLDRPIVQGGSESTPSTPGVESPSWVEMVGGMMLPAGAAPGRPGGPQAGSGPLGRPAPPSNTPATPAVPPASFSRSKFNKAENRRSIRVVADHKRRTLQRQSGRFEPVPDVPADEVPSVPGLDKQVGPVRTEAQRKKDNRRSSSMWDHKLVEVTRFAQGPGEPSIPESPAADGKPGTVTWVKGELIGKGSYGRVYIAMNMTTGDMVAVKQVELPATEIDRRDQRQQGMIKALRDEIDLLKGLEHKNIVAYLGYGASAEFLSIFLEYVPGGTIASIYRTPNQARFEPQLVRFFTEQILEGLAYLHSKNIWHRDLKGDNILVDRQGICKISDFGISKQTSDAYDSFGQATNMKGSVFWMAPEVIHSPSERSYSGKVDIWSLGCVVLEMWSGKRPWGDMEQIGAMYELFNKKSRPPLPSDIVLSHVALDFLNNKCLATDPRDRPMAVDLLDHDFITQKDLGWTFQDSQIGKSVAKKGAKTIKGSQQRAP